MPSLPPVRPEDEANARKAGNHGAFDAPTEDRQRAQFDFLLRLGDDGLILGQRLSEWTGHAPSVEVDLSLANMALDLVGQATHLPHPRRRGGGQGPRRRRARLRRDVLDMRNCLLVEQPNGDFAQTMARQLLFSSWQKRLFDQLATSADERIAAVAAKGGQGSRVPRGAGRRVGDPARRRHRREPRRMGDGLEWMWRFVPELFEVDEVAGDALKRGLAPDPSAIRPGFDARLQSVLVEAGLEAPKEQRPILGGRRGHHSEHLGHLLAVMQYLPRTYPDAVW
jgi:ring-1,2-phenylacetyl-CoA epoxidase subunit PaaC